MNERLDAIVDRLRTLGYANLDFSFSGVILELVSSRKGESYLLRGNIASEQIQYLGLKQAWVEYIKDIKEHLRILKQRLLNYSSMFGAEPRVI